LIASPQTTNLFRKPPLFWGIAFVSGITSVRRADDPTSRLRQTSAMPAINGRIGLILTARAPVVSAAWYQSVFGFEVTGQQMDDEGRVQQICLQDGQSGFTLCLLSHGQHSGDLFNETRTGLNHAS
jgi:hypothetical protein